MMSSFSDSKNVTEISGAAKLLTDTSSSATSTSGLGSKPGTGQQQQHAPFHLKAVNAEALQAATAPLLVVVVFVRLGFFDNID